MNLFVTGGAGFIGANFINHWLDKYPKDSILNLDIMSYCANPLTIDEHRRRWGSRYKFVQGCITDANLVRSVVERSDIIVHFAAESHVDRSVLDPQQFLRTNVIGTQVLLEAAVKLGGKRFHHISTDEVFGTLPLNSDDKFTELTPYQPRSPYSASKAASDHIVRAYHETYGLPITVTNCSNNYGAFQYPEKVIPLMITRALRGLPFPIYGNGVAIRDYLHVQDHCQAIELVLEKGRVGETYCVGGDSERNTVQTAQVVLEAVGAPSDLIRFTKDRPGHDPRYAIDHGKITKELGWRPQHTFLQGIQETVSWYKSNQAWWSSLVQQADSIAEKYLASAT